MHECPNCGQACDCIGDDLWNDLESQYCQCDCEWARDNGLIEDVDEGYGIEQGYDDPLP